MLTKAVAAVKSDKAKALDMFNKGRRLPGPGPFYVFCANLSLTGSRPALAAMMLTIACCPQNSRPSPTTGTPTFPPFSSATVRMDSRAKSS